MYIGQRARPVTKYLILDLDDHSGNRNDLFKRYDFIRKIYPEKPFVFDTPRQGFHVQYLLDHPVQTKDLIGAVESDGIKNIPAQIEVNPSTKKFIRLPLGAGTHRLDPDTLQYSIWDKNEAINSIRWDLENGKSGKLSIGKNYRVGVGKYGLIEIPKEQFNSSNNKFVKEVQFYLKNGLQAPGTRHEVFEKLMWYYRVREGYTPEQAEAKVIQWIESKNGGLSVDWKERPKTVLSGIKSLSKSCDPGKCKSNKKVKIELLPLGVNDIRKVLQLAKNYNGKQSFQIKTAQFIFDFLQLAKSNGKVIKQGSIPTIKFLMSMTKMETWKNCSTGGYLKYLKFCKEANLLLFNWDDFSIGTARSYQIQWRFCDDPERYKSLQDYLKTLSIKGLLKIGISSSTAYRFKNSHFSGSI